MSEWHPIDTCPKGKRVLFWWRPSDSNPFAECSVIGELPTHPEFNNKWWNAQTGKYQEQWHLLYWTDLPADPIDIYERRERFWNDYKAGRID